MTTVRGITSRVDIVWTRNGIVFKTTEGVSINSVTADTLKFTDWFTTAQINTSDDGVVYQCKVVINIVPEIIATSNMVVMDITGMYCVL